jgi:hypothetical protein
MAQSNIPTISRVKLPLFFQKRQARHRTTIIIIIFILSISQSHYLTLLCPTLV